VRCGAGRERCGRVRAGRGGAPGAARGWPAAGRRLAGGWPATQARGGGAGGREGACAVPRPRAGGDLDFASPAAVVAADGTKKRNPQARSRIGGIKSGDRVRE